MYLHFFNSILDQDGSTINDVYVVSGSPSQISYTGRQDYVLRYDTSNWWTQGMAIKNRGNPDSKAYGELKSNLDFDKVKNWVEKGILFSVPSNGRSYKVLNNGKLDTSAAGIDTLRDILHEVSLGYVEGGEFIPIMTDGLKAAYKKITKSQKSAKNGNGVAFSSVLIDKVGDGLACYSKHPDALRGLHAAAESKCLFDCTFDGAFKDGGGFLSINDFIGKSPISLGSGAVAIFDEMIKYALKVEGSTVGNSTTSGGWRDYFFYSHLNDLAGFEVFPGQHLDDQPIFTKTQLTNGILFRFNPSGTDTFYWHYLSTDEAMATWKTEQGDTAPQHVNYGALEALSGKARLAREAATHRGSKPILDDEMKKRKYVNEDWVAINPKYRAVLKVDKDVPVPGPLGIDTEEDFVFEAPNGLEFIDRRGTSKVEVICHYYATNTAAMFVQVQRFLGRDNISKYGNEHGNTQISFRLPIDELEELKGLKFNNPKYSILVSKGKEATQVKFKGSKNPSIYITKEAVEFDFNILKMSEAMNDGKKRAREEITLELDVEKLTVDDLPAQIAQTGTPISSAAGIDTPDLAQDILKFREAAGGISSFILKHMIRSFPGLLAKNIKFIKQYGAMTRGFNDSIMLQAKKMHNDVIFMGYSKNGGKFLLPEALEAWGAVETLDMNRFIQKTSQIEKAILRLKNKLVPMTTTLSRSGGKDEGIRLFLYYIVQLMSTLYCLPWVAWYAQYQKVMAEAIGKDVKPDRFDSTQFIQSWKMTEVFLQSPDLYIYYREAINLLKHIEKIIDDLGTSSFDDKALINPTDEKRVLRKYEVFMRRAFPVLAKIYKEQ